MIRFTWTIGLLLMVLGIVGYSLSSTGSPTAFIPSALGLILTILGLLSYDPSRKPWAMHTAIALAFIGAIAAGMRAYRSLDAVYTQEDCSSLLDFASWPLAAITQTTMATICCIYVGAALVSFLKTRFSQTE